MRKMNVLMFLVLLFCYLMAGGCARVEEAEIDADKGGIVMSTLVKTGEDLIKNIQKEAEKEFEVDKKSEQKSVEKTSDQKMSEYEEYTTVDESYADISQPEQSSQVNEPVYNAPEVVVPQPVEQPAIEVPACDASIPGGAYLDYNTACNVGEAYLNGHWGEGYHYSVNGQINGCGTWYYILSIYHN